jgi:hypothetical protein
MPQESIRSYEFVRAIAQVPTEAIASTSASSTITAASAHGLAAGDIVSWSVIGTMTNVTADTRYFVLASGLTTTAFQVAATPTGTAIAVGSSSAGTFKGARAVVLPWANQSSASPENTSYDWEGDAQQASITLLRGITVELDLAAIPADAHALIFDKSAITGTLPGGGTEGRGYGGGGDVQGTSVGLLLEGFAVVRDDGIDRTVTFVRWYPQGTITLRQPSAFQTGQIGGVTGYSFSATRTATDILGATITGAPTGGDFYYEFEV